MSDSIDLKHLTRVDEAIVSAARNVKVLSRLSWPAEVMETFLADWKRGQPSLPSVSYDTGGFGETRQQLVDCVADLNGVEGPVADYLRVTAQSYATLCSLLESAGTARVTAHSTLLYGKPGDLISGGQVHNLQAAEHFLEVGAEYYQSASLQTADYCLSAETVRDDMTMRLNEVFPPGMVAVEVDPNMSSKAAAGATRVRLRAGTCFSSYDLEQLLQHEAFVHSLTALNGRSQPHFKSFGLGSPRTTGPQEGLATFSELVTGAIDISRMERIALRVVAIQKALSGANFIEVFSYLLEVGQTPEESFYSTMRVFRGAPVTGGSAFTKDVVYLHGLMEVHTFFRWAMQHQRLSLTKHFFAGRMTIGDVVRLQPAFDDGLIAAPTYLPPWMSRTNGLAAYLAFSVFANRITIDALDEHHDFEDVADLGM